MDRRAGKTEREIAQCSLSSMAYLLSELVQYTVARSASHEEVISRLMNAGFEVGRRAVEIVSNRRDRSHMHMRPVTVLEVVRQVSSLLWPYLFGKQPDSLQRDDENEGTFYLIENTPKFTKFMSEPIRAQQVSSPLDTPGYFVAGIVKGYLAITITMRAVSMQRGRFRRSNRTSGQLLSSSSLKQHWREKVAFREASASSFVRR